MNLRTIDLVDLDRRALADASALVARIGPVHLSLPTPCADWTLHGLLRHVVGENDDFAAGARTGTVPPASAATVDLGERPHARFQASVAAVLAAFAPDGARAAEVSVREFGTVPGPVLVGMHFVDSLVHGWDAAVTIGAPFAPAPELVAAGLALSADWPDSSPVRGPGGAFGATAAVSEGASDLDVLLARCGRTASWTSGRVPPC